jgi:DNA-directed RNA polymerase sigma subunit (sigma70/sigma32)
LSERCVDGKPRQLQAIADDLGVTRERVRQLESKGLNRIKDNPAVMARLRILWG